MLGARETSRALAAHDREQVGRFEGGEIVASVARQIAERDFEKRVARFGDERRVVKSAAAVIDEQSDGLAEDGQIVAPVAVEISDHRVAQAGR